MSFRVSSSRGAGGSGGSVSQEDEADGGEDDDESEVSLFIGNLPVGVSSKWVYATFNKFGRVVEFFHPRSHGRFLRYVFVHLLGLSSARATINFMDGHRVSRRFLVVRWACRRRCDAHNKLSDVRHRRSITSFGGYHFMGSMVRGSEEKASGRSGPEFGCSSSNLRRWVSKRSAGPAACSGYNSAQFSGGVHSGASVDGEDVTCQCGPEGLAYIDDAGRKFAGGDVCLADSPIVPTHGMCCKCRVSRVCCDLGKCGKPSVSPACSNGVCTVKAVRRLVQGCDGNEWLSKSVVAVLRDDVEFELACAEIGVCHKDVYRVCRLSAKSVLMSFQSTILCKNALVDNVVCLNDAVSEDIPGWNKWFVSMNLWCPGVSYSLWVSVLGIPINAWNHCTFQAIASISGSLIDVEEGTSSLKQFSAARFFIDTHILVIFEGVDLIIDGLMCVVHVSSDSAFSIWNGLVLGLNMCKQNQQDGVSLCNSVALPTLIPKEDMLKDVILSLSGSEDEPSCKVSCQDQDALPKGHAMVANGVVYTLSKVSNAVNTESSSGSLESFLVDVICNLEEGKRSQSAGQVVVSGLVPDEGLSEDSKVLVDPLVVKDQPIKVYSASINLRDILVIMGLGNSVLAGAGDGEGSFFGWELIPHAGADVFCSGKTILNRGSVLRILSIVNISLQVGKVAGVPFSQQDEWLIKCLTKAKILSLQKQGVAE